MARLSEQSTANCLCVPGYSFVERACLCEGPNAVNLRINQWDICCVPHSNPRVMESTAAHIQNFGGPGCVHQQCATKRVGSRHESTGLTGRMSTVSLRVFGHPELTTTFFFLVPGDHPRRSEPPLRSKLAANIPSRSIQPWNTIVWYNTCTHQHSRGHTLNVVITQDQCPVRSVLVEPPVLSDHSFIITDIDLRIIHGQSVNFARRCQWRKVNYDELRNDLFSSSAVLQNPPSGVSELFACYDEILRSLVVKHALFSDVKVHAHANAPWYDTCCHIEKSKARRLESTYQRCRTNGLRPDVCS